MIRIGHNRRRQRKRIGIPKGMLRHVTLDILKKEPMSGTELMDEIEYYTDWRPSPGSVYPLLSKLEEQGLIKLVKSDEPTLKRYALTNEGVQLIEERKKLEPNIRSRHHSIQKMYWRLFEGMNEDLFNTFSRLLKAVEKVHPRIKNNPNVSLRLQECLLETAKEVEKIHRQLVQQE